MWRKIFFLPYLAPMRAIWWTRHRYILNENPYDKVSFKQTVLPTLKISLSPWLHDMA